MADPRQRVAIAVVEQDGCYLVGTRGPAQALAGCSEFPGGKFLPQEDGAACAVRECREETGVSVTAVRRLFAGVHAYPHGTLDLEFWLCRPDSASTASTPGGGYAWIPAQALHSLRFPEANRPVIQILAAGIGNMS